MKNLLVALFKAGITGLLFYLLFRKVDVEEFLTVLAHARIDLLLAAFTLLWLAHYICLYRWRMLMNPLMPVPPMRRLFTIYCIGLFFNLAFPTVVGGDVVKMYYAGKPSRCYAQSFAATFLDRDAGMLAMMMIASVSFVAAPVRIPGIPLSLVVWGGFAVFMGMNVVLFTPVSHRWLSGFLRRLGLPRIADRIDSISNAFQVMGRHRIALAGSLAISVVNQLLVPAVTWMMAIALGIRLPYLAFLILVPVITLISMAPVSLNGMGLREYAFLALLSGMGADREAAIALGLLSSAMVLISAVPGGVVYMFFRQKTFGRREIAAFEAKF